MRQRFTTFNCYRLRGYQGSFMWRISQKIYSSSQGSSTQLSSQASYRYFFWTGVNWKASQSFGSGFSLLIHKFIIIMPILKFLSLTQIEPWSELNIRTSVQVQIQSKTHIILIT